jgi:hypothetical protein
MMNGTNAAADVEQQFIRGAGRYQIFDQALRRADRSSSTKTSQLVLGLLAAELSLDPLTLRTPGHNLPDSGDFMLQ